MEEGRGAALTRNLYLMGIDGSGGKRSRTGRANPAWSADSQSVAFVKNEYKRYDFMDFATKGIFIYDLKRARPGSTPTKTSCTSGA